ncbi:MAG: DUF4406 domain-containing protein [Prevotellaceae bacterium]|jgi:hypothetical protein|nr:DUF4406 domain-containing protein [Prevotellaceae bacterium]
MKVYISVPISGRAREGVCLDVAEAMLYLNAHFEEVETINPLDLGVWLDKALRLRTRARNGGGTIGTSGTDGAEDEARCGDYMGYDLSVLINDADAVAFCKNWIYSKGCRLEHAAAEIYGKRMIFLNE